MARTGDLTMTGYWPYPVKRTFRAITGKWQNTAHRPRLDRDGSPSLASLLVPGDDFRPQPEPRVGIWEMDHWAGHVRVAAEIRVHRVPLYQAEQSRLATPCASTRSSTSTRRPID